MAIGGVSRAAIAPDSCRLDGLVCARTVLDAQRGAIKRRCPRREPTHTRGKGSLLRAGLGLGVFCFEEGMRDSAIATCTCH